MSAVALVAFGRPDVAFLWHNVVGAVVVFVVGMLVSSVTSSGARTPTARPAQ
jgi:hypothetical protein